MQLFTWNIRLITLSSQHGRQTWNGREYSRILASSKTCNIIHQTWNPTARHVITDVKHETCNTSREIYDLSRQVCNMDVKHETIENILYFGFIQDMQPLTLNMQPLRLTCNHYIWHATTNVKHETCNTSHEICNLSRKVRNFNLKHETGENIPEYSLFWLYSTHATSYVKHDIQSSNMQQLTLNMKLATLHAKYATYHVKFATSTWNMKQTRIFWNILYFGFIQHMQHLTSNMKSNRRICNNWR